MSVPTISLPRRIRAGVVVVATLTGAAVGLEYLAEEFEDKTTRVVARALKVSIVAALVVVHRSGRDEERREGAALASLAPAIPFPEPRRARAAESEERRHVDSC